MALAMNGGQRVPDLWFEIAWFTLCVGAATTTLTFCFPRPKRNMTPLPPAGAPVRASARRTPIHHSMHASMSISEPTEDGRLKLMGSQATRALETTGDLPIRLDVAGLSSSRPLQDESRWIWTVEQFVAFNPTPDPIVVAVWLLVPLTEDRAAAELRPETSVTLRIPGLDKIEESLQFTQWIGTLSEDERLDPPLAVKNPVELVLLEIGTERETRVTFKVHPLPKPAVSQTKSLSIIAAVYGANETWNDVKNLVIQQARGDRISMHVTNDSLGGDPIYGLVKTLKVTYTVGGAEQQSVEAAEGGHLSIP